MGDHRTLIAARDDLAVARLDHRVDPLTAATLPGLRDPAIVTVRGWTVVVADPIAIVTAEAELDALADACGWRRPPPPPAAPPFTGGAVGVVTDALSAAWLDLPTSAPGNRLASPHGAIPPGSPTTSPRAAPAPLPDLRFGLYDSALCVAPDGETVAVARDLPGSTTTPAQRVAEWRTRAAAARDDPPSLPPAAWHPRRLAQPTMSRAAHAAAVERVLGWIAAGDLYQLNLTLQLRVPWPHGGAELARRLWAVNPGAAHAAWLRLPDHVEVVSVSPETFLRVDGDTVAVRPIKGTRPRHADPTSDAEAAVALQTSAKDAAEHVMIVDLERNDLGRVCRTGSVTVPQLAALEAHPTVWHLTSTVTGRLRGDVGLAELLRATFPCGSVTGAPKRMAVQRTRLVETVRRGVYCGAIGVVTQGLIDLSVAIRTATVHDETASYGTGGGIVADSTPDGEWHEAMDKAAAFLRATGAAVEPQRG